MISRLLPALQAHLAAACAHLHLASPEKDEAGREITRAPQVFIGDFPARREAGPQRREFPCILLLPHTGWSDGGEEVANIAAILCVYNPEDGDGAGLEMDLAILQNTVAGALRRCLHEPLEQRFMLLRDEKERSLFWQRGNEPNQPRPYLQVTIVSRWSAPGWE